MSFFKKQYFHIYIWKIIINKVQFSIGLLGLFIGWLVYVFDRSPEKTYFIFKNYIGISFYGVIPKLFGSIGDNLPAYIHVFSFIMMTASFFHYSRKNYIFICLFWLIVDFMFELGQKFKFYSTSIIPEYFSKIPFLDNAESYFLNGTYDVMDLAAVVFGTLTAYLILIITKNKGPKNEN